MMRVPIYQDITGQIDTSKTRTLDVGCGNDKIPGAVGIDLVAGPQIDIVHDLDRTPWPVDTSAFDLIRLWSVMEHLHDIVAVLEEIHWVGRPGARVLIGTPHFSSANAHTDPTHVHFLSGRFLDYFVEGTEMSGHYGFYSKARFTLLEPRDVEPVLGTPAHHKTHEPHAACLRELPLRHHPRRRYSNKAFRRQVAC